MSQSSLVIQIVLLDSLWRQQWSEKHPQNLSMDKHSRVFQSERSLISVAPGEMQRDRPAQLRNGRYRWPQQRRPLRFRGCDWSAAAHCTPTNPNPNPASLHKSQTDSVSQLWAVNTNGCQLPPECQLVFGNVASFNMSRLISTEMFYCADMSPLK